MHKKDYQVPALTRALNILEFIGKNKEASFTEIYSQLDLPKSSAYQLLGTLVSRGYLRHSGASSLYSLGLKLFELGNQAVSGLDIRAEALPILRKLVGQTNETCHLGILDGVEGVYLAKLEGSQPVRLNSWEGKRLFLHCTAMGKALLAFQDEDVREELIAKASLKPMTENSIVDPELLRRHLALVRERGWALDDQENEPHIRCVGAPVRDIHDKVVAAISISGLATRFGGEYLLTISELVRRAADELSQQLGRNGNGNADLAGQGS